MTPRILLNLGILLAVIVLAVIAFYPGQHTEPATPMVTLLTVNKADVKTISIQGSNKPALVFTKQDQQWFMTAPAQVRADEHHMSTLLNILEQPADHKLVVDKNNLSKYGLDSPLFTMRFNDLPVAIGGTDPIRQRRYIMAQDTVYLVDDSFSRWLGEGAGAFIDAALLPPGSIIKKVQLPDFEVVKTDTQWQYNPLNSGSGGAGAAEDSKTAHFSPDSLQTFIDEWRYGRALQVSLLNAPYDQPKAPQVKVFLQGQSEPVVFHEETSADDTAFVRADLNIRYHLTKDTLQRLTKITEPQDIESDPDAEPANEPTTPQDN